MPLLGPRSLPAVYVITIGPLALGPIKRCFMRGGVPGHMEN